MNFKKGLEPKVAMNTGISGEIKDFIKEHYNIDSDDVSPNMLMRLFVDHNKLDLLEYAVNHLGADIHNEDEYCLRWAARYGFFEIVKFCVEHGADISKHKHLAYRMAKQEGHEEIAEYLLNLKNMMKESTFGFKRGIEPKDAMGTGMLKEIQDWLEECQLSQPYNHRFKYTINKDLTINVNGGIHIFPNNTTGALPEFIQFNKVHGSVQASEKRFKSLKGFPKIVTENCNISKNLIKSLEGAPELVGGEFNCSFCHLKNLQGAPKKAKEFRCDGNFTKFTFADVFEVCDVEEKINVHTWEAQQLYNQRAKQAKDRKTYVKPSERTSHLIKTEKHGGITYKTYTKGYKSYKVYQFIRDNEPVTHEQIGRFAHEMSYGKTFANNQPFTRSTVSNHVNGYVYVDAQNPHKTNDKVRLVKKGKFKYLDEYVLSPIGEAFVKSMEQKFGNK